VIAEPAGLRHVWPMKKMSVLRAYAVHFLTATGAVFAMLAMLAAVQSDWQAMVLWLLLALAVDGIDGPLARKYDVKLHAPIFDGVLLDLIIDYLTYVFIPAFALYWSGLLTGLTGWAALIIITFASVVYFADTRMKTKDNSFKGFPGCWNMLVLVIFAIEPPPGLSLVIIVVLAAAMFLPLKFIHPVRTTRWRVVSLPVALIWSAAMGWAAWVDFAPPHAVEIVLMASSVYLLLAGVAQQVIYRVRV
jgi:phosphatidylcholine synthase